MSETKVVEAKPEKKELSKPWRPPSKLEVLNKDPNFRYRWVAERNLESSVQEGWEIVRAVSGKKNESAPNRFLFDGTPLDSTIRKGNLILCRVPEELAQSMEDYYKGQSDANLQTQKRELTETAKAAGAKVFGEFDIK